MIDEKIIERTGKRINKNFAMWYQNKVLEMTDFVVKKLKNENITVKNHQPIESCELEVMVK